MFRVLIFGDIIAKPGRRALAALLPALKKEYAPQLTIANAENLAHGISATERTLGELRAFGIDLCTSGNHVWAKSEAQTLLNEDPPYLLRPANYPPGNPGTGVRHLTVGGVEVVVMNFQGRVFMGANALDCPFRGVDEILEQYKTTPVRIIDFHAEATSEKIAFGQYVDGRASVLFGTHTHVPTADETILPQGTGYITDVGMTGLKQSVIGANPATVREMFLYQTPRKELHDTEESGLVVVNALLVDIDPNTGHASAVQRIHEEVQV